MSTCHWCGQEGGTGPAELRPYGPDGADICFDCGMSEEHGAETMENMLALLHGIVSSGHTPVITDDGIQSL